MSAVKFSLNMSGLNKKLAKIAAFKGAEFEPEVTNYARMSLTTAARMTPVREYATIKENQEWQWLARVNCIPSSHKLVHPSLRVNENGEHWVYFHGKWFNAANRMPADVYSAYVNLLEERNRRMSIGKMKFINGRAQARFLYRRSWSEAAESLGVPIPTSAGVRKAATRRKPAQQPPRACGRRYNRDTAYTISVSNPFLEQESRYKPFSGNQIFHEAAMKHQRTFMREVSRKLRQICSKL